MTRFAKAALALVALTATPAMAEDWSSLLLDRTVTITLPDSFAPEPAFSDASSGNAIVEFLPIGETVDAWSQMLTLTGYAGAATGLDPYNATMAMAEQLANGYAAACPGGLGVTDLGAPALGGADAAFAAWLACDQVGDSGTGEAMVVLIFAVGETVYTAQWAERGPATSGPPAFDMNHWLPRLDTLMTLQL